MPPWCTTGTRWWPGTRYGNPAELPNIYHRLQYEQELDVVPDFRIACIFVDQRFRRQGLSVIALQGALDLVAAAGGGVAEGNCVMRRDGRWK